LEEFDQAALDSLVARLGGEPAWTSLSARMRAIASTACDPEKIHAQFIAELPRRVARPKDGVQ
jgi:hypothetical protein